MKLIGNILWFVFFGFLEGLACFIAGIACCITVIGIPFGIALFRLGKLVLLPFGKNITINFDAHPIANIIWLLVAGIELAGAYLIFGVLMYVTIIGIPFGKQCFKLMKVSALPFGADISDK